MMIWNRHFWFLVFQAYSESVYRSVALELKSSSSSSRVIKQFWTHILCHARWGFFPQKNHALDDIIVKVLDKTQKTSVFKMQIFCIILPDHENCNQFCYLFAAYHCSKYDQRCLCKSCLKAYQNRPNSNNNCFCLIAAIYNLTIRQLR